MSHIDEYCVIFLTEKLNNIPTILCTKNGMCQYWFVRKMNTRENMNKYEWYIRASFQVTHLSTQINLEKIAISFVSDPILNRLLKCLSSIFMFEYVSF